MSNVVDFYANTLVGQAPLVVTFTLAADAGSATSYQWSFGDGQPNSTQGQTNHPYRNAGTYTVSLTCTFASGPSPVTTTKVGYLVFGAQVASFTFVATGRSVQFTDTSAPTPAGWLWDFGDGTTSSAQSPLQAYSADGTYAVKLTVYPAGPQMLMYGYMELNTDCPAIAANTYALQVQSFEAARDCLNRHVAAGYAYALRTGANGQPNGIIYGTYNGVDIGGDFNPNYSSVFSYPGPVIFSASVAASSAVIPPNATLGAIHRRPLPTLPLERVVSVTENYS